MSLVDRPLVTPLADGRLQLRHGPIDLLLEAFGESEEVQAAYHQATIAFSTVLTDLVSELNDLRKQSGKNTTPINGKIAAEMAGVATMFSKEHFVTPMIAVAGAVADHILEQMVSGRDLSRAYVNNGGDMALYLAQGQSFSVGVCDNPLSGGIATRAQITADCGIKGIATSGWRGRSHSLGIADAVTVLACTAATADAAATLIANTIDLPNHPMIKRQPANELNPDSDLQHQLVTVDVGELTQDESDRALDSGQRLAQSMIDSNQIIGVYGSLNSRFFSLGLIAADCDRGVSIAHHFQQGALCA